MYSQLSSEQSINNNTYRPIKAPIYKQQQQQSTITNGHCSPITITTTTQGNNSNNKTNNNITFNLINLQSFNFY